MPVAEIQNILQKSGRLFSADAVLKSEMRVLKTLGYRVCLPTPVLYVEIFMRILSENCSPVFVRYN